MKKKQETNSCALRTSIGGQALMEGIMMRGPKQTALAVRNPKGEIVVEKSETRGVKRPQICRLPIIRGIFGYIDSMVIGYKALMRSAEISGLDDVVEKKPKKKKGKKEPEKTTPVAAEAPAAEEQTTEEPATEPVEKKEKEEKKLPAWVVTATMVFSIIFGFAIAIGLFVGLPIILFELFSKLFPSVKGNNPAIDSLIKSVFEGVLKVIILVGYMAIISLMKDIRRTFRYHGAEHKSIFCYEAGKELTVENVRSMRRFHPRCGTSFLILMVLVSIFVSIFIDPAIIAITGKTLAELGRLVAVLRMVIKILLIPIIVGIGYELIKLAGRHDNWFTRVISAPGLWLQRITVLEPDDSMIECAIAALKAVIPEDGSDKI